jgi:two-component system, response regulator
MPTNGVEILLVEESPRDAELTLRALRKRNLTNHIVHVADGQAALNWLFAEGEYEGRSTNPSPRMIVLDVKLPKVDGIEVLRAIRADERTRRIPVVVLTSSREEQDIVRAYDRGVNSYMVKPVDFEEFSAAVTEAGHYWLLINGEPK